MVLTCSRTSRCLLHRPSIWPAMHSILRRLARLFSLTVGRTPKSKTLFQVRHGLLLAAMVVLLPAVPLTAQQATSPGAPSFTKSNVAVGRASTTKVGTSCFQSYYARARALAVVSNFNPHSLKATVSWSLCLSPYLLTHIFLGRHALAGAHELEEFLFYGYPVPPELPVPLLHDARFRELHLQLQYFTTYPPQTEPVGADENGSSNYLYRTPSLTKFIENDGGVPFPSISLGSFTIQMAGGAGRFPFDWYAGQKTVSAYLPAHNDRPLTYCANREAPEELERTKYLPTGCESTIPVEYQVFDGLNNGPFQLGANVRTSEGDTDIALWFSRPWSLRLFVLVMAVIPLLLGLLFYALLFRRGRNGQQKTGPELVIAITAALLAILPIRSVLVPAEISQLTTIDYLLGSEVAVLASITCIAVWGALKSPD